METRSKLGFDEKAKEACECLLEQFWVRRDQEPEKYQLIREREGVLKAYFLGKLGYRLIVHRHFIKLEKTPAFPEPWMGIQDFRHPRDYAIFCCLLAYLEGKNADEQFLLSDLCEEIVALFPGDEGLDWTHYEHRKSLIRAMQFAQEQGIIKVVEGDVEQFRFQEEYEVLYDVPAVARYFLRSYPEDLNQFTSGEEILAADQSTDAEDDTGARRRQRVYRQLFLSPVMYSRGSDDTDFLYLRNYRHRIQEDIESHTEFQFELYKDTALLTFAESKARYTLFPDTRAINDIVLQFADVVKRMRDEQGIAIRADGSLPVTRVDFEHWVRICRAQFGSGWSKQYRDMSDSQIARDLFAVLVEWKMAAADSQSEMILLQPLLVRLVGAYPEDYVAEAEAGTK